MRRPLFALMLAVSLCGVPAFALAVEAAPEPVTGPELASATSGLDGRVVRLAGEVVSEKLDGGDGHVWVNVLSEGTAIGVWMAEDVAGEIEVFGDWAHVGDRVRVVGTFQEGCDIHGGDLDVHAEFVMLTHRGYERHRSFALWKLAVGLAGLLIAYAGYAGMRNAAEEKL